MDRYGRMTSGPDGDYVRVTIRLITGDVRTFWAAKPRYEGNLSKYLPLTREGVRAEKKILGGYRREIVYAHKNDVVHEFKAYLDGMYCELRIL